MIAEEIETPVSQERNKKQTFILLAEIFTERINVCFLLRNLYFYKSTGILIFIPGSSWPGFVM